MYTPLSLQIQTAREVLEREVGSVFIKVTQMGGGGRIVRMQDQWKTVD